MNYHWIRSICLAAAVWTMGACSYPGKVTLPAVGMPEQVVVSHPMTASHRQNRVGVLSFDEPAYARGVGRLAARALCRELLRRGLFASITLDLTDIEPQADALVRLARAKDYDLIITGRIRHFFEGSRLQAARVVEEIRLIQIDVIQATATTLWLVQTDEAVEPVSSKDYIFVQRSGAPPPSTEVLLQRNAQKFCNLLEGEPAGAEQADGPSQAGPAGEVHESAE